jgi:virulence factor
MLVGIIGLGEIARKAYLPVLASFEGLELSLCSRSEESVARMRSLHRVERGTTQLQDLIDMGIKAAFVLSPSDTHKQIAQVLLENGVDVFLEKPATLHSSDTRALAELAERKKRVLMVGFNRRYAPLHVSARQMWNERIIGMAIFQKHRSNASHPHLEHQFTDDTIHQIDLLRFFCGEAEVVNTVQYVSPDRLLGAVSTVSLERGGYGMVITSLEAGRWQETYTLHGSGRSMVIDAFTRLRMIAPQEQFVHEEPYASSWLTTLEARGFNHQVHHFIECVNNRSKPKTSAWEALKTQLLLEKMVASLAYSKS